MLGAPPPWTLWFAVFAAAAGVLKFVIELFLRSKDKAKGVVDDYWYRTVLMPDCVTPLQSFLDSMHEKLKRQNQLFIGNAAIAAIGRAHFRDFIEEFQEEKQRLVRKFFILRSIDTQIHETVATHLDDLEDKVIEFCVKTAVDASNNPTSFALESDSVLSVFDATHRDVIEKLIQLHRRLF